MAMFIFIFPTTSNSTPHKDKKRLDMDEKSAGGTWYPQPTRDISFRVEGVPGSNL